MDKKVLIIAYYFPPLSGAGVFRPLKFVKYLRQYGYEPVVCAPYHRLVRSSRDYHLLKDIPAGIHTYRSFIIDLNWLFKVFFALRLGILIRFINNNLLFPDYQRQWNCFARMTIRRIMRREKIDCVFISSPPHSLQLLGIWIKKKYKLPLVIDFRDPFTYNNQSRRHALKERVFNLEQSFLSNADAVIANTSHNRETLLSHFTISSGKVTTIPNGYDPGDFNMEPAAVTDTRVVFSHIGHLYDNYNALPLLRALVPIKDQLSGRAVFRFVGKITPADAHFIQDNGLENIVDLIPYCPHDKAIAYMLGSEYLVLVLADSKWKYWIPSKVYEYIYAGKPILAIVPEKGNAAGIIHETGTGIVISPDQPGMVSKTILSWLEGNAPKAETNRDAIRKYDRGQLTEALAAVFESIQDNANHR